VEQNIGEKIIWRSYWRFGAWTEIFAKMIKTDKRHDAVDLMCGVVNTNFALDTDLKIVGSDFGKIKMEVGTEFNVKEWYEVVKTVLQKRRTWKSMMLYEVGELKKQVKETKLYEEENEKMKTLEFAKEEDMMLLMLLWRTIVLNEIIKAATVEERSDAKGRSLHLLAENDKQILHKILQETLERKEKEEERMEKVIIVDEMVMFPPRGFVRNWWGQKIYKKIRKKWKIRARKKKPPDKWLGIFYEWLDSIGCTTDNFGKKEWSYYNAKGKWKDIRDKEPYTIYTLDSGKRMEFPKKKQFGKDDVGDLIYNSLFKKSLLMMLKINLEMKGDNSHSTSRSKSETTATPGLVSKMMKKINMTRSVNRTADEIEDNHLKKCSRIESLPVQLDMMLFELIR
jgi:hypothetical protein